MTTERGDQPPAGAAEPAVMLQKNINIVGVIGRRKTPWTGAGQTKRSSPESQQTKPKKKNVQMKTAIPLAIAQLGLVATVALADPTPLLTPASGISLEFIGQGRVVSPAEVYQYGYFTHVAGVENAFGGTPNNATNAFFTFMNKLSTTRATPHGPLTVVDRKGTTTIYLNPAGGASFETPTSFEAGTAVLTASLRHQVILDTLSGNTIFMQFDLTVISAETFTVGDEKHQLARPGQKMTWINYGRPNTSTNQPGQFVFAGAALSHDPAPPGLSINRPTDSSAVKLAQENAPGNATPE